MAKYSTCPMNFETWNSNGICWIRRRNCIFVKQKKMNISSVSSPKENARWKTKMSTDEEVISETETYLEDKDISYYKHGISKNC